MARLILPSLLLAISVLPAQAQSTLYTDRSGYTSGTQDGRTVNTYTDRYGNTTVASTSALTVTATAERRARLAANA
jgi:hypothetical protein